MPGGRPTKYRVEMIEQAKALAKEGATDFEVAKAFKVNVESIYEWKNRYPEFSKALKVGKRQADKRVERSLYERATGYSFEAVKIFLHEGKEVIVKYIEHVPPDATSMIFWLKNRRKDKWRDFRATEISTPPGKPLALTYTPTEPQLLASYYAKLEQAAVAAPPDPSTDRLMDPRRRGGPEQSEDEDDGPR